MYFMRWRLSTVGSMSTTPFSHISRDLSPPAVLPSPLQNCCGCRDTRHSGIAECWRSAGGSSIGAGRPNKALHPWVPGRPQAGVLPVPVPRRPRATLTCRTWPGSPAGCGTGCRCPGNRRRRTAGSAEWRC